MEYFFLANEWKGEIQNMEPDKCDEVKSVNINELPINTIPYIKYAIEQYLDNQAFTDFGW